MHTNITMTCFLDLQQLQGGLIKAVVPTELASLELALDMTSVGILNEAIFECSDQQTQQLRDQADMSVHERNYVFLKNQLLNKVTVEKRKVEVIQLSAKVLINH